MATESSEKAVNLVVRAYQVSELTQQQFGALLELMAFDFKLGVVCEPLDPAETDPDKHN
ncbi:hypothetical protein [Roseibium album]|uniref:hypothetical protein n=1 Tax=Roseibium album TaxID=311410 RepID=UPI003BAEA38F